MNSWANVGDLVFVLSRDKEPIPCKVIKEIGTGTSAQLFFETIEDSDKNKIPKKNLKAFLNQVGYAGGYVFKEKQNALDYLEELNTKGSFNMSSMITKKTRRVQEKMIQKSRQQQPIDIQKIKDDATAEAVNRVHKIVIASMLLALNSKLHIGPKRGAEIVEEINRIIAEELGEGKITQEELLKKAEEKMKIKIGD